MDVLQIQTSHATLPTQRVPTLISTVIPIRAAIVRPKPEESPSNGTPDQKPAGAEGIRLQSRRRIPRVSFFVNHTNL